MGNLLALTAAGEAASLAFIDVQSFFEFVLSIYTLELNVDAHGLR